MNTLKTVNDMYSYSKAHTTPLLSNYSSSFWNEYVSNYARYDALFRRMFMSFRYFMQETHEDLEEVTINFIDDVYNHLMVNDKKYSELYRVNVLNYSSVDGNYDVSETMDKNTTTTNDNTYGSRTDETSDVLGARIDNTSATTGNQNNSTTNTIAGFNSTSFSDSNKSVDEYGSRTDTSSATKGQQNNTSQLNKGSQTDSLNEGYTEDYTLVRKGYIYSTPAENVEKHNALWSEWNFYEFIFKEICAELLVI